MIIDDERGELEYFAGFIDWKKFGFNLCATYSNSPKAYEALAEGKTDVVFSDISMPKMDGLELARRIKTNYPGITVVLISAYGSFEYAQEAIRQNVFDYVTKPFDYDEIVKLLIKIRKRKEEESSFYDEEGLPAMECQQAIIDYCYKNIDADEFVKIYKRTFGNINMERTPAAVIKIRIDDFVEYLNSTWTYGKDRLYSCIMRYIRSDKVNFIPVEYAFNTITVLAVASETNAEKAEFESCCTKIFKDAVKLYENELQLRLSFAIVAVCDNITVINSILGKNLMIDTNSGTRVENFDDISQAKQYIEENYRNDISLTDIAERVHLSPYHFSKKFRAVTGETVTGYITRMRLEEACRLLVGSDMSVINVAQNVGYKNKSHFYKMFRMQYEITPQEYRNKSKGENR